MGTGRYSTPIIVATVLVGMYLLNRPMAYSGPGSFAGWPLHYATYTNNRLNGEMTLTDWSSWKIAANGVAALILAGALVVVNASFRRARRRRWQLPLGEWLAALLAISVPLATASGRIHHYVFQQRLADVITASGGRVSQEIVAPAWLMEWGTWKYPFLPSELFQHITAIRVHTTTPPEVWHAVERLPYLRGFHAETRAGDPVDLRGLVGLNWLRSLRLIGPAIRDEHLHVVLQLRELTDLQLQNTAVTDQPFLRLADLSQLTILDLEGSPITDESLATISGLRRLQYLNLKHTRITGRGLAFLHHHPRLATLELDTADGAGGYRYETISLEDMPELKTLSWPLSARQITLRSLPLDELWRQTSQPDPLAVVGTDVLTLGQLPKLGYLPRLGAIGQCRFEDLPGLTRVEWGPPNSYTTNSVIRPTTDLVIPDGMVESLTSLRPGGALRINNGRLSEQAWARLPLVLRQHSLELSSVELPSTVMADWGSSFMSLMLHDCRLRSIDWSKAERLERLTLSALEMESLKIAHAPRLVQLFLGGKSKCESFVLSDAPLLEFLQIECPVQHLSLPALPALKVLSLRGSFASDGTLSQLPDLPNLETMDLAGTQVTVAGLTTLARFPRLSRVQVTAALLHSPELASVRQALPNVEILR